MKIIEPSFTILHFQENALEMIERAARLCYASEPKGNPEVFTRNLIKKGHETPLEMGVAIVSLVCDRGVMAEVSRHRLISLNVQSTRYCNFAKDKFGGEITLVRPSFWDEESIQYKMWHKAMMNAEASYMALLRNKATPEEARSVLPNSLMTEIQLTANMRMWRHIFKLRCSQQAHPQMRQLALPLLEEFYNRLPVLFEDIYAIYDGEIQQTKYRRLNQ